MVFITYVIKIINYRFGLAGTVGCITEKLDDNDNTDARKIVNHNESHDNINRLVLLPNASICSQRKKKGIS